MADHSIRIWKSRNKNNKEPIARLKEQLNFYFGNKYDDYFGTKIKIIKSYCYTERD